MRVLLSKKSKKELFEFLINKNDTVNLRELANKINISYKTINNWRYDYNKYIPSTLLEDYPNKLEILEKKEDNWGQVKGGKISGMINIENARKLGKNTKYHKIRKEAGKKAIRVLTEKYGKDLFRRVAEGKMKKTQQKSKGLDVLFKDFFTNKKIVLDNTRVQFSKNDINKNIKLPTEMSPELAEEIGVHLGDGCLRDKRNYFSVKTNKKEEKYMTHCLFPLYKKLYDIDLKLMRLPSVVGFELYSKAISEFKNKILDLPYGEKIYRIEIPQKILNTKNRKIYSSCIRGLFDTDGCIFMVKSKRNYPIISITSEAPNRSRAAGLLKVTQL